MDPRLERVRSLAGRLRRDGTIPPTVASEMSGAVAGTVSTRLDTLLSRVRRSRGAGPHQARSGATRWRGVTPLRQSIYQLAIEQAETVVSALSEAGIETFVVDFDDQRFTIGILAEDRDAAAAALARHDVVRNWGVRWHYGPTHGSGIVGSRAGTLAHATEWELFALVALGEQLVGDRAAARITFWEVGTSGMREQLGVRGQQRFPDDSPSTVETFEHVDLPGREALPVSRALERCSVPIDAVYTWVDDQDPAWRSEYLAARQAAEAPGGSAALSDDATLGARFSNHDELLYSLRSLYYFCGWIRHIYIVTAGQRPQWLVDHPMVTLVDHRDILPDDALPTFNSHVIESALHHIDGLSEHFIYLNDDFFVGRPLSRSCFFEPAGNPHVFVSDARIVGRSTNTGRAIDQAADVGRRLALKEFGKAPTFKPEHAPFALKRSMLFEIEKHLQDVIDETRRHRFRTDGDLSLAASFAGVWGLGTGQATAHRVAAKYTNLESRRLDLNLRYFEYGPPADFLCINATESVSSDPEGAIAATVGFLERTYPAPAPWEAQPGGGAR